MSHVTCEPICKDEIPQYIFTLAESFSAAVNSLVKGPPQATDACEGFNAADLLIVPTLVNESFSVELYFKCLHSLKSPLNIPRGHDSDTIKMTA